MAFRRVVSIEGEIAAGKTELARALGRELERRGRIVALVLEPVARWREIGILGKFYSNPSRFGYSFETYIYATRTMAIVQTLQQQPDAEIVILERSPVSDQLFMELQRSTIDPVEYAMYETWRHTYDLMLHPHIVLRDAQIVYLKPTIDCCMGRLAARGRVEEQKSGPSDDDSASGGVSAAYQRQLRRVHEAFFERNCAASAEHPNLPPNPFGACLVLDGALAAMNFRDAGDDQTLVVNYLIDCLGL
jgi:deoxyadenosine/deoxycytidine kinase